MKSLAERLAEYQQTHQNPINQLIHKVCIPLIVLSLNGLLFSIPFPATTSTWIEIAFYNWAAVVLPLALFFYFRLSFSLAFVMTFLVLGNLAFLALWQMAFPETIFPTCLIVFILSWIMQFVGHKIEGKKPAFFKDLEFLLIGPLWTLMSLSSKKEI